MEVRKSLRRDDRCPAVAVLQAVLIVGHFRQDETAPCGKFGKGTRASVIRFQEWAVSHSGVEGLVADGEVAGKTFEALRFYLGVDLEALRDEYWPQE